MNKTLQQKIISTMDGPGVPEFFILDAHGAMVKLFYTEELDTVPFSPPLTVYTWDKQKEDWKTFKMARLKDLFTSPAGEILSQNVKIV